MLGQMDLSGQGSWFDCLRISKETWVEVVMGYRTKFTAKGKSDPAGLELLTSKAD